MNETWILWFSEGHFKEGPWFPIETFNNQREGLDAGKIKAEHKLEQSKDSWKTGMINPTFKSGVERTNSGWKSFYEWTWISDCGGKPHNECAGWQWNYECWPFHVDRNRLSLT